MPIEITASHMQASEGLQEYAREKAQQILEDFPRVEHVHVILDVEKHSHKAEVVVQARNHVHAEATESSENFRVSIDLAMDKIERQLRKLRDKVQDHKPAMRREENGKTALREEA